jgi:hypothetical protein
MTGMGIEMDMWYLSDIELEQTYKRLCKEWHPDRHRDRDTTEQFQEIQNTYERIRRHRQNPEEITLSVSLTELYHGCVKDVSVKDPRTGSFNVIPIFIPMGTIDGTVILAYHNFARIKVREVNDTKFVRDGYNLILHVDLSLAQALIGDPLVVGHFNTTVKILTQILTINT